MLPNKLSISKYFVTLLLWMKTKIYPILFSKLYTPESLNAAKQDLIKIYVIDNLCYYM